MKSKWFVATSLVLLTLVILTGAVQQAFIYINSESALTAATFGTFTPTVSPTVSISASPASLPTGGGNAVLTSVVTGVGQSTCVIVGPNNAQVDTFSVSSSASLTRQTNVSVTATSVYTITCTPIASPSIARYTANTVITISSSATTAPVVTTTTPAPVMGPIQYPSTAPTTTTQKTVTTPVSTVAPLVPVQGFVPISTSTVGTPITNGTIGGSTISINLTSSIKTLPTSNWQVTLTSTVGSQSSCTVTGPGNSTIDTFLTSPYTPTTHQTVTTISNISTFTLICTQGTMVNLSKSVLVDPSSTFIVSPVPTSSSNPLGLNAGTSITPVMYDQQLVWKPISGYAGYAIYVNGTLLDTTVNNYYHFSGNAMIPGETYTFTVTPVTNLTSAPATISYLPPSWWQSLLAQVFGATSASKSSQNVTAPDAPKVINTDINVLAIAIGMVGTDKTETGPGSLKVADSPNVITAKLFGSSADSVKSVYYQQSGGKVNIIGDVVPVIIPHDDNFLIDIQKKYFDQGEYNRMWKSINTAQFIAYVRGNAKMGPGYTDKRPSYNSLAQYNIIVYVWPTDITWQNFSSLAGSALSGVGDPNATVSGAKIFINSVQNPIIYIHEIGHVLGLKHGDSIRNFNCLFSPNVCVKADVLSYDDSFSIMGSGNNVFIDHDKAMLGWIPYKSVTQSGLYTIDGKSAFTLPKKDNGDKYYIDNDCDGKTVCGNNLGLLLRVEKGSSSGYLYNKEMILLNKAQVLPLIPGTSYEDFVNSLRVINIKSTNIPTSEVFVRFDAVPKVTATPSDEVDYGVAGIDWTWPDVAPTGGYEIYRDGTAVSNLIDIVGSTANSYDDTLKGLNAADAAKSHTYYVRAYDAFDSIKDPTTNKNKKFYMPFSIGVAVKAIPYSPDIGYIWIGEHLEGAGYSGNGSFCTYPSNSNQYVQANMVGTTQTFKTKPLGMIAGVDCSYSRVNISTPGYTITLVPNGPSFSSVGGYNTSLLKYTGFTVSKK